MIFKRISKGIRNPKFIIYYLLRTKIARSISDETFLRIKYKLATGKKLDLKNPRTYTEKLQWQKLYDRKPEYTQLVDKYRVRAYIGETIGEEYLIPLLGVYRTYDEIDFDALPDRFVLKPNHTSGEVYICQDKAVINHADLKKCIKEWLKTEYFWFHREWPYKGVKPLVLCEKYLTEGGMSPNDYKVMCFNGKAKLIQVHVDRFNQHLRFLYDTKWSRIDIKGNFCDADDSNCPKPVVLETMIALSEQLAKDLFQVRIDWYIFEDRLYFGEITFFDGAGFVLFQPEYFDDLLGSWIKLPVK